nr:Golgi resident protein GCP60-like [Labrus bergylta]
MKAECDKKRRQEEEEELEKMKAVQREKAEQQEQRRRQEEQRRRELHRQDHLRSERDRIHSGLVTVTVWYRVVLCSCVVLCAFLLCSRSVSEMEHQMTPLPLLTYNYRCSF